MNFDTEFSMLFGEIISKLRDIDCTDYKPNEPKPQQEGNKIPIYQVDTTLMNISYKLRDEKIPIYQKLTFLSSMSTSNVELLFTFFQGGKPGSHPGYLSSNVLWGLFRDVLVNAKKNPSQMDGGLLLFSLVSGMLAFSADRFIYQYPEVIFDLVLAPPRVVKINSSEFSKFALSDDIARIYEVEHALGLGNSIAQNIISWYQFAMENKKEKANLFSCDVDTFDMILKLTKDRLFMFLVEILKKCRNDRMMAGFFLDSFNDLIGTMRLGEREDFLLGSIVERSFAESNFNEEEQENGRMDFLKHVFMSDQNTREEHVNFIIDSFSNHPSKKIRDSLSALLGQHLIRKIKKRINEKKLTELKTSTLSHHTDTNQEEYLLLVCEFGGRKRKFVIDRVHSVSDIQQYLTKAYTERKRNSEAISTKEEQDKIVSNSLQLFLPANQAQKPEEGAKPEGDWVDLDDFNVLQLSYRDINTKKTISEKINQVKFVKKVTTKESTKNTSSLEGGSFVSNSFVPSTFEEDDSALATKASSGFTQAQQFSAEKTNSLQSDANSNFNSGKLSTLDSTYSKPQGSIIGSEMSGIEMSGIDGISVMDNSLPQFSTIEMSSMEGGATYFSSDDEQD